MTRGKKIFAVLAVIFVILLLYASYDISNRTTFPGSKPQLKERLKNDSNTEDSLASDSIKTRKN
jgi:hypothetical protein